MRCLACNVNLSDFEATRKYLDGTFVDLCNKCWQGSQMFMDEPYVLERDDLNDLIESDWENEMPILHVEREG